AILSKMESQECDKRTLWLTHVDRLKNSSCPRCALLAHRAPQLDTQLVVTARERPARACQKANRQGDCRLEGPRHDAGKTPPGDEAIDQGDPQPLLDEGEGDDRNIDLDIEMQPRAFPRESTLKQHARQGCAAIGDDRLAVEVAQRHGTSARQPM